MSVPEIHRGVNMEDALTIPEEIRMKIGKEAQTQSCSRGQDKIQVDEVDDSN